VVGDEMLEVQKALDAGDHARARALDAELHAVYEALSVTTNPIPVKAAMELLGFAVGPPRLPLVAATEDERSSVRAALERLGRLAPA
jgi:4-hydroxy-tetrahydrodipicolinate synthase